MKKNNIKNIIFSSTAAVYKSKNKPIFEHSLDKIIESKLFKHLILVTNKVI